MMPWMKSEIDSQNTPIITKRQNAAPYELYQIGISGGNSYSWGTGKKITFLFRENSGNEKGGFTTADIDFSQWTQVFVVLDKDMDTVKVYIDGLEVPVTLDHDGNFPNIDNTDKLHIGGNPDTSKYFDGEIDDVRIYDVALTPKNIEELFLAHGGGINGMGTHAKILNCVIEDNYSGYEGGGIYDFDGDIINCIITGNIADQRGGGLADCDGTIINSIIAGNEASNGGGLDNCDGDIFNCTIADNEATTAVGGLRNCDAAITNTIIWYNGGATYADQISGGTFTINYNCIQGWTSVKGGTGNISGYPNPSFVNYPQDSEVIEVQGLNFRSVIVTDSSSYAEGEIIEFDHDGVARTIASIDSTNNILYFDPGLDSPSAHGMVLYHWKGSSDVVMDLRLRTDSPCLDAGDNSVIDTKFDPDGGTDYKDFDGKTRIKDGNHASETGGSITVDIGAYELPTIWHVDGDNDINGDGSPCGDGSSWEQAFNILDDALETASPDDEIWVAAMDMADYVPTLPIGSDSRDVLFLVKSPMYGGFTGNSNETARQDRDWVQNETVLSGDIGTPGLSTDNAYHVVIGVNNTIVDGFTVQNGYADSTVYDRALIVNSQPYPVHDSIGGGVYNFGALSVILQNSKIKNNHAIYGGGGTSIIQSPTQLINCLIDNNTSNNFGGGIYIETDLWQSLIINCTIANNQADYWAWVGAGANSFPKSASLVCPYPGAKGCYARDCCRRKGVASFEYF